MPNSPPLKGKNASMLDAPANESTLVKRNDPHAAHPMPSTPLVMPNNPVASPERFTSSTLCRKKYTIIDTFKPKRTAIATVYEADSRVKLVTIDPKRLIGRSSFSEKDI